MSKRVYYKNREKLEEYNVPEDWYKNRKPGISGFLRIKNEEEFIGPCLESILPFFDEIVIGFDSTGTDRTLEIIKSFRSDKIKVFDYPFFIWSVDGVSNPDSVHDMAYYWNWLISKTSYQIIGKWDGDMIMLPSMHEDNIYDLARKKNIVRLNGYNLTSLSPPILSKDRPMEKFEIRFYKIKKIMHWVQGEFEIPMENGDVMPPAHNEQLLYDRSGILKVFNPLTWVRVQPSVNMYRIKNFILHKDVYLKKPMFLHAKYLKKKLTEDRKSNEHKKIAEQGVKIDLEIPKIMFKNPEDYI